MNLYQPPIRASASTSSFSRAQSLSPSMVSELDLGKRLLDYGIHPLTVYFPLIVDEAIMIEPTETETKETLDHFAATIATILEEAKETRNC